MTTPNPHREAGVALPIVQTLKKIVEAHSVWMETDGDTNAEMHACARMNSAVENARALLAKLEGDA
jgi:hypothetical protein